MTDLIKQYAGEKVHQFVFPYFENNLDNSVVLSTTNIFNIDSLKETSYKAIINLSKINDIRRINKFFAGINSHLETNGIYICCAETLKQRKKRIKSKYIFGLNYFFLFIDLIFRRTLPHLPLIKKIYFALTEGKNRVLSRTEILGRLYSCGFTVVSETFITPFSYFVMKKSSEPLVGGKASYGMVFGMQRIGRQGKIIKVYKFRTMYPFAEYLQEYIYQVNNLSEGGKFKDDFRITRLGKILRKLWLDELPMLINIIKGEVKLVGVRPLSEQYLGLYPEEFRERRLKYKPGLIPPFYVDLPSTLNEIILSEEKYFDQYDKKPFITDVKYFFKALINIFIKRARSS